MKTKKVAPRKKRAMPKAAIGQPIQASFTEVVTLIEQSRKRAYQAVNTELVGLYWQMGKYISKKLETAEWGEGVVDHMAQHLSLTLNSMSVLSPLSSFETSGVSPPPRCHGLEGSCSPTHLLMACSSAVRSPHP